MIKILFLSCFLVFALHAAEPIPPELEGVGIEEHLGKKISIDTEFNDEEGNKATLASYLSQGRPLILAFVYYECPNLCTLLLNGLVSSLKDFEWKVGEKFEVVAISIDPREDPKLAFAKRQAYGQAWHFLTGTEENIRKLTDEVGFKFHYDEDQKQYAHTAAIYFITPDGILSRYLYGIQFQSRDLRLGLLEASHGKIGGIVDRLLLFCYHYDPKGKRYALFATRLMKVAGAITVLLLILFFIYDRKTKNICVTQRLDGFS